MLFSVPFSDEKTEAQAGLMKPQSSQLDGGRGRDAILGLSDSKTCVCATLLGFFPLKLAPLEAPGEVKRRPELPPTHILVSTRAAVLLSVLHTGHLPKPSLKPRALQQNFKMIIWLKPELCTFPDDHDI